jgi:hypothetical protein
MHLALKPLALIVRVPVSRRGGLCTPVSGVLPLPVDRPSRPPAYHQRTGANDMPRLAYGLATRTRRPRPSENTDLRVMPGFSPQGHPSSDDQSGGGAGSARPQGRHNANRNVPPFGHRPLANSSAIMTRSGLRPARIRGRGDRVPCMYNTFAVG